MNYSASLLLLLLFVLVSCDKEANTDSYPDEPFGIGLYDSNDFHKIYDPPIRPYNLQIDLDLDGETDLIMGSKAPSWNHTESWRENYTTTQPGNQWRIGKKRFKDSIFMCQDTLLPHFYLEYNRIATTCSWNKNEFKDYRTICSAPFVLDYEDPWPGNGIWGTQAYNFYKIQGEHIHIRYNLHDISKGDHYLILQKQTDDGVQKAWIRFQRNFQSWENNILILELAVQAEGSL